MIKSVFNEKGVIHLIPLLIVVSAFGLITFLLISSTGPFGSGIFDKLFGKPKSQASENKVENVKKEPEYISNEILIKVKKNVKLKIKENPKDTGIASINSKLKKYNAKDFTKVAKKGKNSKEDTDLFLWYKVTLDGEIKKINLKDRDSAKLLQAMKDLDSDPNIEAVELNSIVYTTQTTSNVPNDYYYQSVNTWGQGFDDHWGLRKINMEAAWQYTKGSSEVVVAVIDTGVDRNHEDLKNNMWVNVNDPLDGVDNDDNGYQDDYYGWNFVHFNNEPMDDHGHGTHVAGTIGAVGNNGLGVVGVNWQTKIMTIKILGSDGRGSLEGIAKGLQYAADMGARISSNSYAGSGYSQLLDDGVKYEHDKGMTVIVAAGNYSVDALDFSPSNSDYTITVGASDYNDLKASFSNWGQKIDVVAPGVDILSTRSSQDKICPGGVPNNNKYCVLNGTSMATPHVSGLAALLLSKNPQLTNEQIRQIIRQSSLDLGNSGKDSDYGYGRINSGNSLNFVQNNSSVLAPIINYPLSRTKVTGTTLQVIGSADGANFASYKVEVGNGRFPTSWTSYQTRTTPVTNGLLEQLDVLKIPEGKNIIRVTVTDKNGKEYQYQVNDIEVDHFDAEIVKPNLYTNRGVGVIQGTARTKNSATFGNYRLEWGEGSNPTSWSTAGITLENGGSQPVADDTLGKWDTSNLTPGNTYTLKLSVWADNGWLVYHTVKNTTIDMDLVDGWPKEINFPYADPNDELYYKDMIPALADINNDGLKEILIAGLDGKLYVYSKDGKQLEGFPYSAASGYVFGGAVNVDDIDGDGNKEIIAIAANSDSIYNYNTGKAIIYVIKNNGVIYPGWPSKIYNMKQLDMGYDQSPTIYDLNGDGKKELIFIEGQIETYTLNLHVLASNNLEISGFPKTFTMTDEINMMKGPLAVSDMDADGRAEIAFSNDNKVYLTDNTGNILPGWPFTTKTNQFGSKYMPYGTFTFGDINGDRQYELFIIARGGFEVLIYGINKDMSKIYGPWNDNYSTEPTTWANFSQISSFMAPIAADIDKDQKDEIIVGASGQLEVYDENGFKTILNTKYDSTGTPVAVDLKGDGSLFIATGAKERAKPLNYNLILTDSSTGVTAWSRLYNYPCTNYTPILATDLDNNLKIELIAIVNSSGTKRFGPYSNVCVYNKAEVYLWEIPITSTKASFDWPMWGHDSARTNNLGYISPIVKNITQLAPTNLKGTATSWNQIDLTWDAITGIYNSGASIEYRILRNGTSIGLAYDNDTRDSIVSFSDNGTDGGINENSTYNYQVVGYDIAGNRSLPSNMVTITTPAKPDTTPPTVSITSPSNNGYVTKSTAVNINANASDTSGVSKVEFYVNNVLTCTDTTSAYSCSWRVPVKTRVIYTLTAKAYDTKGNIGTSSIKVTSR